MAAEVVPVHDVYVHYIKDGGFLFGLTIHGSLSADEFRGLVCSGCLLYKHRSAGVYSPRASCLGPTGSSGQDVNFEVVDKRMRLLSLLGLLGHSSCNIKDGFLVYVHDALRFSDLVGR